MHLVELDGFEGRLGTHQLQLVEVLGPLAAFFE
jgi:hypothetical protein